MVFPASKDQRPNPNKTSPAMIKNKEVEMLFMFTVSLSTVSKIFKQIEINFVGLICKVNGDVLIDKGV